MSDATAARTYASLCIYGDDLDPPELTQLLGIEPTSSKRRGDAIRRGRTAPRGVWIFTTRDICDSEDSSVHIAMLSQLTHPQAEALKGLQDRYLLRVFVYWSLEDGNGGPVIDPQSLGWLAEIGAELHVDLYESAPSQSQPD